MDKQIVVSVVMPFYSEDERHLRQAVESILHQTYAHWELILVCDNPSNKQLLEVAQAYQEKEPRISLLINGENLGRSASRNKALQFSQGDYVAILDADDIALPKRLEEQIATFHKYPEVDFVFSWVDYIDDKSEIIKTFAPTEYAQPRSSWEFIANHMFIHPSMMVDARVIKKLQYDQSLQSSEDFDMWIRAGLQGKKYMIIQQVLGQYRLHREDMQQRIKRQRGYAFCSSKLFFRYLTRMGTNKLFIYFGISKLLYGAILLLPTRVLVLLQTIKSKI